MSSTYTSTLRLNKQGTGDNPNTWGSIANTGVFDLLDDAVNGLTTVNVTGTGDYTLSVNNGASDESRAAILKFTGTPSAARNVVIPGVSKIYVLVGAQTAETLTIKTTSGTGIDINNGETKFVYCDGTDVALVSGDALLIANNLSDLANASTARTNLGLGGLAVLGAGDGVTVNGTNLDADLDGTTLEVSASGLKATAATVTQSGVVEIATQTEVDTGTDTTRSITPETLASRLSSSPATATAWVNFNGQGTVTINGDLNVASITDNGVGDYTLNFDTAMNNTNYSAVISTSWYGATITQAVYTHIPSQSTGSMRIVCARGTTSYVAYDPQIINVVIFGGV